MLNTGFLERSVALIGGLLISVQVLAFEGKHREIDWSEELQLSDEQQQKIEEIEQRYRDERKEMREDNRDADNARGAAFCEKMQAEYGKQLEQMRAEIHAVLTAEQKERATAVIREQHLQMQLRHARDVAHRLEMNKDQKEKLLNDVLALKDDYQWPLDLAQHEAAREHFDAVLRQHLTDEQVRKWELMREKQMRKWHHHEDRLPGCRKPEQIR